MNDYEHLKGPTATLKRCTRIARDVDGCLAPPIDLPPWQLAAAIATRPKPPRIRQSLHRCRVMLRVNVLVEPIVFHPGVFARFLERHRAIGAAYRADLPSQTSPAISATLRVLDFAKGRIDFAELAADALDR